MIGESASNSSWKSLDQPKRYIQWTVIALVCAGVLVYNGVLAAALLIALPGFFLLLAFIFKKPKLGFWLTFGYSFAISFLTRYVPPFPWGIGGDIALAILLLIIFFKYYKELDVSKILTNRFVVLMFLWFLYLVLELFNPLAPSFGAWFYSMRGLGLYQLLIAIVGISILQNKKDFFTFANIWFILSIVAVIWGWKQLVFGVSTIEQAWLDTGEGRTHILFGNLRVFSYYFDGATYGSGMAQASLAGFILSLGPFKARRKLFYFITGLLAFYGMLISGTRGALAVPAAGGIAFLIMTRNMRLILFTSVFLIGGYVFLRYTYLGNNVYQIQRMRTAVDPNDASLLVRFKNRARLTEYLQGKPFGGGIGSSGHFGQRFAPGTWLANFAPDGLYTRIRAEGGVIGKYIYLAIWLSLLARGMGLALRMPSSENKYIIMALVSSLAGVLASSYSESVMTQFPVNFVTFTGLVFIELAFFWDKDGNLIPNSSIPSANLKSSEEEDIG